MKDSRSSIAEPKITQSYRTLNGHLWKDDPEPQQNTHGPDSCYTAMSDGTAFTSIATPDKAPSIPSDRLDAIARAKHLRNRSWLNCPLIPSWVNFNSVDLDRFFTRPEIAAQCSESLFNSMREDNANLRFYTFVDPGAGTGVFYDLLPFDRRIGIDVLPTRGDIQEQDFLSWTPPPDGKPYAVLGNPPFGYRAWLSLAFVNHSATFADYIGVIVPMAFQSDGKGSPKLRVKGAELILSEPLPVNSFVDANGQSVKLNALWQIWRRGVNNQPVPQTCNQWIDIFTVDSRIERLCGQKRLSEADWFLQRTYFGDPPTLVRNFSEVRYRCGYGIVLRNAPDHITRVLRETDWRKYSNLAVHNCRHISMYHIRQAVIDAGFVDG